MLSPAAGDECSNLDSHLRTSAAGDECSNVKRGHQAKCKPGWLAVARRSAAACAGRSYWQPISSDSLMGALVSPMQKFRVWPSATYEARVYLRATCAEFTTSC